MAPNELPECMCICCVVELNAITKANQIDLLVVAHGLRDYLNVLTRRHGKKVDITFDIPELSVVVNKNA